MTIRVIRAGEHVHHIGLGISVRESGVAVAGVNWWEVPGKTCVAAYQPKGAASYAASKTNLANPGTYDAANGAAYPHWDATNGWMFDAGKAQTIDCGFAGPGGQTWTALCVFTNLTGARWVWGHNDGGAWVSGYSSHPVVRAVHAGGASATVGARIASGVVGMAGRQGYVNGTATGSLIPEAVRSGAQNNMHVGSNSGWSGTFMSVYVRAIAWWSDTLTADEVATVSAAMAAL